MFPLRRHRRLLRATLLVLLALGMVVKPTLGALSELHDMEHAAAIAHSDDGHGHAHPEDPGHEHGGDESDPDHATGAHGLMHQGASPSIALPDAMMSVSRQASSERLPDSGPFRLPGDAPNLPFRPPIA
jgi:hypothetical protein